MTNKLEFYKCKICGNIVQVIISGTGTLSCCGEEMELLNPKTEIDTIIGEKHTPIIERRENETVISLKNHPMENEHYIQFIESIDRTGNTVCLKYLHPQDKAEFVVLNANDNSTALSYCNIHGLWKGKEL